MLTGGKDDFTLGERRIDGAAVTKRILVLLVVPLCLMPTALLGNCGSRKKFPKFEQFPVAEAFHGKIHPPILQTRLARRYRTQLRLAIESGVNFAGHYVVATWGCGTGCAQFAIIDALTGSVIEPPFPAIYFHHPFAILKKWPDFEGEGKWWCEDFADWPTITANSELLVVQGCVTDHQCGRTFYALTPAKLKQIYFDPDRAPDGSVAPP